MTEPIKSRMSPEERAARRSQLGRSASEKIAKSEQLNFRLDEDSINALQQLAHTRGIPVGAMIRDWVLERLAHEKLGGPEGFAHAARLLDEFHQKLNALFLQQDDKSNLPSQAPRSLSGNLSLGCQASQLIGSRS